MGKNTVQLKKSVKYSFVFVVIFWVIHLFKHLTSINFSGLGILPRNVDGLWGVLTAPFIHGDFDHLIANTVPFFFLSCLLFFFYEKKASLYLILIWITAGLITWIIGRSASHIGASGVIYGLASFLVFGGIFSKNWKLILIAMLVAFIYSGLIFGIFPTEQAISWEGHLGGALAGLLWAFLCRKSLQKTIR